MRVFDIYGIHIYIDIQYGAPVLRRVKRSLWYHWAVKAWLPELMVAICPARHMYFVSDIHSGGAHTIYILYLFLVPYMFLLYHICFCYTISVLVILYSFLLSRIWFTTIINVFVCFCMLSALMCERFRKWILETNIMY